MSVEIADAERLNESSHRVEVYVSKQSLDSLISRLQMLREQKLGEHIHMMSESWGLGDLSDSPHDPKNVLTNHLKFVLVEEVENLKDSE